MNIGPIVKCTITECEWNDKGELCESKPNVELSIKKGKPYFKCDDFMGKYGKRGLK